MIGSNNISKLIVKAQQRLALENEFDMYEYIKKAQNGDEKAKELVICKNFKLVLTVIYQFTTNATFNYDDLFSIGLIGLAKAVKSFDCNKSYKFSTYAYRCIYNEVAMEYRKNKNRLTNTISLEDFVVNTEKTNDPISLEKLLQDPKQTENLLDAENKVCLQQIMNYAVKNNILKEIEIQVLILVYGLSDNINRTMIEVGTILNMSPAYVCKTRKKAIAKLRKVVTMLNNSNTTIK